MCLCQIMKLIHHGIFESIIATEKATVNFAIGALRVGNLVEGQIDDPVFDIAAAPERNYDGIGGWRIPCEELDIS